MRLAMLRAKVKGKGKWQSVSPEMRLTLAFDQELRAKALSSKFHLWPKAGCSAFLPSLSALAFIL